jgi:hypothetical protein
MSNSKRYCYQVTGALALERPTERYEGTVVAVAASVESAAVATLRQYPGSFITCVRLVGEVEAWADGNEATL